MSEYITIAFTGMAAVATIVYAFYSIQLWRANRASVEVARLTAFVNLWTELSKTSKVAKEQNLPEAEFLIKFRGLLAEFIIGSLMRDLNRDKDEYVREFYRRVEEMINDQNINTEGIGWLKHFPAKHQ
ncbi:MAG: hypothetical protein ACR2MG_14665 [Pyrinomonadaceae bacterium]